MTLAIVPDPGEPHGGYAFLRLPVETLGDTTTFVKVLDEYSGRWLMKPEMSGSTVLIDEGDWGTEPHTFGPYLVERKDNFDWVRIGPEIVNRLSEFKPLQITIGSVTNAVIWPEDVIPRAAPALAGGFLRNDEPETIDDAEAGVEEIEEPVLGVDEPDEGGEPDQEDRPRSLLWLWLVLLVLLLGLAMWYFSREPEKSSSDTDLGDGTAYEPDSSENQEENPCSLKALTSLSTGFADLQPALQGCGTKVSADVAMTAIERAVAVKDPSALTLMGKLYDDGQSVDVIEDEIGLGFDHDLTRAVEYYARASELGSAEAGQLKAVACTDLKNMTSTLAKGAVNDYCQ